MGEKREFVGYIYVLPQVGDGYILCQNRIEGFSEMKPRDKLLAKIEKLKNGNDVITIDEFLRGLENRKVKITIEILDE